jgi:hypothetical protein
MTQVMIALALAYGFSQGEVKPPKSDEAGLVLPPGFELKGDSLTLPSGKSVETKGFKGVTECGNMVLVIREHELGVYNKGQRLLSSLTLPPAVQPDRQLSIITFDAKKSDDTKAGSQVAYVGVNFPDGKLDGVLRYLPGKDSLQFMGCIKGGGKAPEGRFTTWRRFRRNGSMMDGIDIAGHPAIKYFGIEGRPGKELLRAVAPPSPEQLFAQLPADQREAMELNKDGQLTLKPGYIAEVGKNGKTTFRKIKPEEQAKLNEEARRAKEDKENK